MIKSKKEKFVTVQGLITPVPAALCSAQAGYQSSISSDCNDTPVSLARVSDNATSNSNMENLANPFRKSAKIRRSPQSSVRISSRATDETPKNSQGSSTSTFVRNPPDSVRPSEDPLLKETPQLSTTHPNNGGYNSPRQEFILKMRTSEEEAFGKCQKTIIKIRRAMSRQKNINMDVQNGVAELEELLDVVKEYRRNWQTAEKEKQARQASFEKASRATSEAETPSESRNKRLATSPAAPNPGKKLKEKATQVQGTVQIPAQISSQEKTKTPGRPKNRKRRKRPRKARARPDAVIIKPLEGHSYADVLRNLRQNVKPEDADVAIRSIRKTKTGAILLEMAKGGEKAKFCNAVKSTLKEAAKVEDLKSKATIEIQDLDALSTTEEVIAAITRATETPTEDVIVRLTSTNHREQRKAFVTLPVNAVNTLLKTERIKIAMTNCRIKYREELKRCYRCFGAGHMQWECQGPDRKSMGLCIRCGKKGHKLKDCKNSPECCICSQDGKPPVKHLPGSKSCRVIEQKAL